MNSNLQKQMVRVLMAASALCIVTFGALKAQAESVGYVDIDKLYRDYAKAQAIVADIKVREAELRKMQADFVKQLEETKKAQGNNPVATNKLEKDLNDKLTAKLTEYRDWATTQQKTIDGDIDTAIKESARKKSVDLVLFKQAIFQGGVDLTADVLSQLNTTGSPAAKK